MLITGRLTNTITGQVVRAAGFQYTAPPGSLGASIMIALTNPLEGGLPLGDALKFELGFGTMTLPPVWSWVTIVDSGRIAGRDAQVSLVQGTGKSAPGDTLQVSALNVLADRWTLAPSAPVYMVDPEKIDPATLLVSAWDAPKDGETPILPLIELYGGLNLWQVLERAYVQGCGFERFVTNLPNYPIDRADFTLGGGWHGGATPGYAVFDPVFYEDLNVLYIWDIDRGLPAGYVPHSLALKCIITLGDATAPEEITNAILLSYRLPQLETAGGEVIFPGGIANAIPSKRFEHDTPAVGGIPNKAGYYRQEINRTILEYKDITTGAVVFAAEVETETLNYVYRMTVQREVLTSRQVLSNTYQGKLKTGHNMRLEATYPNPMVEGNPDIFGDVLRESCVMEWGADMQNLGESVLKRCVTETSGVVLVEEELELREGETVKRKVLTAITEAARGANIILDLDKQEEAEVKQYTEDLPIKTVFEVLRETGGNQAQVETTVIDRLKGVALPPVVQSRPGSLSTYGGKRSAGAPQNMRTELIKDPVSIAAYGFRRAMDLNVGSVPAVEARALALRKLYRLAHPRRSVTIELPGVDLGIRRGSVVKAFNRAGGFVTVFVTGFTITGKALGVRGQQTINMILEGIEV